MPAMLRFAALRPFPLLVLFVALVTGLISALWLLPLGLVAYLAMIWFESLDPRLSAKAEQSARKAALAAISSPTFRNLVAEVDRGQAAINASIRQAPPALQRLLGGIASQTDELILQAHDLAARGEVIERYLAAQRFDQLQNDIDQIDRQMAATSDQYTLQQFEATRRALVERQRNAADLQTYIGRIIAQLQNIDANLDNVLAETIRLRTSAPGPNGVSGDQVAEQLRGLNSDMQVFKQVLESAMTQGGATH